MSSSRIYIGNLHEDVRERDVKDFFHGYGKINEISLKKGFGFVEFNNYRDAEDAIYDLDGKKMCGRRISVEKTRGKPRGNDTYYYEHSGRRNGGRPPPKRTHYRVVVENLSSRVSWQDLKDYVSTVVRPTFADAHKKYKHEGIVEFMSYSDMKRAIAKLDRTQLRERIIRVFEDPDTKRMRSMSRSRSRSLSSYRSKSSVSRSMSKSSSRSLSSYRSSLSRSMSRSRSRSDVWTPTSRSRRSGRSFRSYTPNRSCSPQNNDLSPKGGESEKQKSRSRSVSVRSRECQSSRVGNTKSRSKSPGGGQNYERRRSRSKSKPCNELIKRPRSPSMPSEAANNRHPRSKSRSPHHNKRSRSRSHSAQSPKRFRHGSR